MSAQQPPSTGIFSMPPGQAAAQPAPVGASQPAAVPAAVQPAAAATPMLLDAQPTPAEQQVQATPPVEEVLDIDALSRNPTPANVITAQSMMLEKLRREATQMAEQNARLLARDKERDDAERARADAERARAEQAHKDNMNHTRLNLEAALRAALDSAKNRAPDVIDDAGIETLTRNFHADLESAGFDEAQITNVASKMHESSDIFVRASHRAAALRAELEQRELSKAVEMLKPHVGSRFSVSGGVSQPMHPQPTSVFGADNNTSTDAVSTTMFAGTTATAVESGTVKASNAPSTGIFAGILSNKRGASEINGSTDGGNKRALVSETVPMSGGQPPAAAAAPTRTTGDIDFTKENWMQQVIVKSLISGEGVPTEKTLRQGGWGIVQKQMASANGGTILKNERQPRLAAPYSGPVTFEQLDPAGFKYCVEQIAATFSGKAPRPQLRSINEGLEISATFARDVCNYNQNRHLLPQAAFAAMGHGGGGGF